MIHRRALLEWLVAAGGLAALRDRPLAELESLGRAVHREVHAAPGASTGQPSYRSLDAETAPVVMAAAERIIPRTDTPGATDAGVTAFIDVMLTDWYDAGDRERFLKGIRTLNADARSRYRRAFARCSESEQVALLEAAEAEVVALRPTDTQAANASWFAMLKYLTVYGYCTSEPGMREHLQTWPMPMTYNPAAPVRTR
jgi:Gluconate 2-dehydrogenase subunit 3